MGPIKLTKLQVLHLLKKIPTINQLKLEELRVHLKKNQSNLFYFNYSLKN